MPFNMPWTSEHLTWLRDTGETIAISTGENVPVYEFAYDVANEAIMSNWARHFRNHYCADAEIEKLKPKGMANSKYLLNLKFPDDSSRLGRSVRSGDFAEILVADYLEFLHGYYVPRTRYDRKMTRNESSKGSD
ncbi:MAG: virulence associated protein, partial [Alphaproteobacteria bacterium]|nr:virulence associated protein [Alphaproteobacteria bacterium]